MESIVANAKNVPNYFLTQRLLSTLDEGIKYHILAMKFVVTQYGKSVVVDLEDPGDCPQPHEKQFYAYLPKRWDDIFTEDQLKAVIPCVLSLVVCGRTTLPNGKLSTHVDIQYVSINIFLL